AWRPHQAADLGWAGLLPLLQGAGEGALSLAVVCGRHGAADQRATGHAMGGHRLAAALLVIATGEDGVAVACRRANQRQTLMSRAAADLPDDIETLREII